MREIKFRIWDKKLKEYHQLKSSSNKIFSHDGDEYLKFDRDNRYFIQEDDEFGEGTFFEQERLLLEQYTGLKDKNGKEIYEGDKLYFNEFYDGDYKEKSGIATVVFEEEAFFGKRNDGSFGDYLDLRKLIYQGNCEIIGNIHEDK